MRVLFASGIDGFCHRYGPLHWAEQLATQGVASIDPGARRSAARRRPREPRRARALSRPGRRLDPSPASSRAATLARPTIFAAGRPDRRPRADRRPAAPRPERRRAPPLARRRRTPSSDARDLRCARRHDRADRRGRPRARPPDAPATLRAPAGRARPLAPRPETRRRRPRRTSDSATSSGTATHDDDFASLAPALAAVLAGHAAVELLLVGPVALPADLTPFAARIVRRPLVVWTELPTLGRVMHRKPVPLEWRDPFVAAKGAVKWLEAASGRRARRRKLDRRVSRCDPATA